MVNSLYKVKFRNGGISRAMSYDMCVNLVRSYAPGVSWTLSIYPAEEL